MSDPKQFAIFNFTVDNSVEVVPACWLPDEDAKTWSFFPKAGTKGYKKLIKNSAFPIQKAFEKYDGRVLGYYGTYDEAVQMVSTALETSDLEGAVRKAPERRDNFLPAPPSHVLQLLHQEVCTSESESVQGSNVVTLPLLPCDEDADTNPPQNVEKITDFRLTSQGTSHNANSGAAASGSGIEGFHRDVLKMLHNIQERQATQQTLLEAIIHKLEPVREGATRFEFDQFPLSTVESLQDLNSSLAQSRDKYDSLVRRLKSEASGTTFMALRAQIKIIFDDDLFCLHNYRGQSKKTSLLKYSSLMNALIDSLQDNARVSDYSRVAFDQAMQLLLKQACDRVRERKRQATLRVIQDVPSTTSGDAE